MDCLKLKMPYDFLTAHINLYWQDIIFGIKNELLLPEVAISHGEAVLAALPEAPDKLMNLLLSTNRYDILDNLDSLKLEEDALSAETLKKRWLYLVLAWIYNKKSSYTDPLGEVEQAYADFDYPQEIKGLVRYMPFDSDDGRESGEAALYARWAEFIDKQKSLFSR